MYSDFSRSCLLDINNFCTFLVFQTIIYDKNEISKIMHVSRMDYDYFLFENSVFDTFVKAIYGENLKYMATMSILISILIQSYNVPCNNIKTVICIYLTKFLSVM